MISRIIDLAYEIARLAPVEPMDLGHFIAQHEISKSADFWNALGAAELSGLIVVVVPENHETIGMTIKRGKQ